MPGQARHRRSSPSVPCPVLKTGPKGCGRSGPTLQCGYTHLICSLPETAACCATDTQAKCSCEVARKSGRRARCGSEHTPAATGTAGTTTWPCAAERHANIARFVSAVPAKELVHTTGRLWQPHARSAQWRGMRPATLCSTERSGEPIGHSVRPPRQRSHPTAQSCGGTHIVLGDEGGGRAACPARTLAAPWPPASERSEALRPGDSTELPAAQLVCGGYGLADARRAAAALTERPGRDRTRTTACAQHCGPSMATRTHGAPA